MVLRPCSAKLGNGDPKLKRVTRAIHGKQVTPSFRKVGRANDTEFEFDSYSYITNEVGRRKGRGQREEEEGEKPNVEMTFRHITSRNPHTDQTSNLELQNDYHP